MQDDTSYRRLPHLSNTISEIQNSAQLLDILCFKSSGFEQPNLQKCRMLSNESYKSLFGTHLRTNPKAPACEPTAKVARLVRLKMSHLHGG